MSKIQFAPWIRQVLNVLLSNVILVFPFSRWLLNSPSCKGQPSWVFLCICGGAGDPEWDVVHHTNSPRYSCPIIMSIWASPGWLTFISMSVSCVYHVCIRAVWSHGESFLFFYASIEVQTNWTCETQASLCCCCLFAVASPRRKTCVHCQSNGVFLMACGGVGDDTAGFLWSLPPPHFSFLILVLSMHFDEESMQAALNLSVQDCYDITC